MTIASIAHGRYLRLAVAALLIVFTVGIFLQSTSAARGAEPTLFNGFVALQAQKSGIVNGDQIYTVHHDLGGEPAYTFLCAYDMGDGAQISLNSEWGGCQNYYDFFWVYDVVGVGSNFYMYVDELGSLEDSYGPGYHLINWSAPGSIWTKPVIFSSPDPALLHEAGGTIFAEWGSSLTQYATDGTVLASATFSGDLNNITATEDGSTFWLSTTTGVYQYVNGSFSGSYNPYSEAGNADYIDAQPRGDDLWITANDDNGAGRLFAVDMPSGQTVQEYADFGRDTAGGEGDYLGEIEIKYNMVYAYGTGGGLDIEFIAGVQAEKEQLRSTLAVDLDGFPGYGQVEFTTGESNQLMLYPVNTEVNGNYGAAYFSSLQLGNARFDAAGFVANNPTTFDAEAFAGTGNTTDTWNWDFGDNTTATGEDVSHTYTEAGTYEVKLTVEMTDGSRLFASNELEIAPTLPETGTYQPLPPLDPLPALPEINFNIEPIAGEAPLTVNFYSDTSAGGDPEIWAWDFGDGTTSAVPNPAHTYETPGTYTVSLTVTNAAGSDTETKVDSVHAQSLPVAGFSATPLSGTSPMVVNFTNTSTNATSYSWDFGDGANSTAVSPAHTYTSPGTYDVTLTATNADGDDVEVKTGYVTVQAYDPASEYSGMYVINNQFDTAGDRNSYPGTWTNGVVVKTRTTLERSAGFPASPSRTYNLSWRAAGTGSVQICSSVSLGGSEVCQTIAAASTLGVSHERTLTTGATHNFIFFKFTGQVTYDDLVVVDPTITPTATASAIDVELSYEHAASNRTTWPFKSGSVTITANFSEAPANTPAISINQAGSTDISAASMTATEDPTTWTYDYSISAQASPAYLDGAATVSVSALDSLGEPTQPASNGHFRIDTVAPTNESVNALTTPTKINTPTIISSSALEWARSVSYYGNGVLLGTECCMNGNERLAVSPALADGTYVFSAKSMDAAGNISGTGTTRTVTIDTVPPAVPSAPDLLNDSGIPDDDITNAVPMLFGGTAEPNTAVRLYYSGTLLGQSTSNASGDWTISVGSGWGGQLPFNARTVDAAGNESSPSEYLYVSFYNTPPPVNAPVLHPESDTGLAGDYITNDTTPTFTASEDGVGEGIALYLDGVLIASDPGSSLTTTLGPLADGTYSVEARTTDFVNNVGSSAVTLTIQTSAPSDIVGTPVLDSASDSGTLGDGLTNDNTPTLSGTAPALAGPENVSLGITPVVDTSDGQGSNWDATRIDYELGNMTTIPERVTDNDDATYSIIRYTSTLDYAHLAWHIDLGAPRPVASTQVKVAFTQYRTGTSPVYPLDMRFAVDGRNDPSGAWTELYADSSLQPTNILRELTIPTDKAGPWRYVRVRMFTENGTGSYWNSTARVYTTNIVSEGGASGEVGIFNGETLLATTVPGNEMYQLTMPEMADGDYNLTARMTDVAGNYGPASDALALTIDATAPESEATPAASQSALTFDVPYTATDANNVTQVRLFYSADSEATLGTFTEFGSGFNSSPISFTAPEAGTYRFYTVATDELGNIETTPATADATVEVMLGGGNPPPDFGDMNADSDGDTAWTIGASVIADPTAPSGDGFVTRLTAPEGQQANAYSDIIFVQAGQTVTVTGSWRLSGHGTTVAMCFDVGDCVDFVTLGDINGTTLHSIDWTEFTLAATVPEFSEWAYLYWTVGSESDIDNLNWDTEGDATGITRVEVTPTISVSAPALINLGAGIPGDELTANADVVVTTNNATGYDLETAVTDMTAGGTDSIAATALSARNTDGGSFSSFTGENVAMPLGESAERTDASGDTINLDLRILLPFVDTGLYAGTATFTATTN